MSVEINYLTPLIQVFNMRRSLAFYRDVLGFEVHMDSGDGDDSSWVWLQKDGCNLMFNDQYEPGHVPDAPPPERTTWHSDTCIFFGSPDTDAVYEYLRSKGVELEPPHITSYGMKHLSVRDPDGYSICFQQPAPVE